VKVADFGLSRCFLPDALPLNLTQSGVTMGTPLYMSPEQVQGHAVDARSDVYSFGVTAYALLAGQPPFRGQTAFEVALQHVQAEPPPLGGLRPDLPPDLCALIHRMMAKKPDDRPQTAREVLRELARLREAVAGGATGALWASALADAPAPEPGRTAAPAPAPRRPGTLIALGLACALAVLAGAGLDWWFKRGATAEAGPAGEPIDRLPLPLGEEDHLLRSIRQLSAAKPEEAKALLKECTRLGLMYLQTDQFVKAEAFFAELTQPGRDEPFRRLGRVGQALLLSRKNEPDLSNDAFREVMPTKSELPRGPLAPVKFEPPLDDAELRFAVVQALNLGQFRQYLGRRAAKGA
jgi:eukaryotic-like serine/threonine-protein kinase